MFERCALAVPGAVVCAALAAGCGGTSKAGSTGAAAHPVVLRMANQLGDVQPLNIYADEVARLTHGSVRIRIDIGDHRAEPHAERGVVADVRAGRAQLGWVPPRTLDELGVRSFQPLIAPLLVDGYALQQKVLQSRLVDPMLASLRSLGIVGLGIEPGPMRRVLGVTRAVRRPADVRGRVFGIADSQLETDSVRALGATPKVVGPTAPITGTDVFESQLNAIYGNLYFKRANSVTANLALWPRPLVLFANAKVFAALTGAQRQALRSAATNVVPAFTRFARSDDAEGLHGLCNAGVRFVNADLAAFRHELGRVYRGIARGPIARIEALKHGAPADPVPTCAGTSRPVAARARTVLDGVYRKTLTPAQAHSSVPENYGTFIKVFDRGRFAQTGRSPRACQWSYGRYVLHGSSIRFINIDGGGITPTNAGAKPGETVDLHWRLFRGALLFTGPEDPDPGDWHRISSTPSSKDFERRCPPPANWDR